MAIQALTSGYHSIDTELETLLCVIIYVLLGGMLPWEEASPHASNYIACRQGFMTLSFEEQILAKVQREAEAWVRRMHDLFFPPGNVHYTTEVSCEQFRDACTL